jgi:hypothetical protein
VYEAFKTSLFQLVSDLSSDSGDDAFLLQWIEVTNWTYVQTIGQLNLTMTVCTYFALP